MRQAADTKVLRFRHCARLIPCTNICKPDMEEISKAAAAAVEAHLDCCAYHLLPSEPRLDLHRYKLLNAFLAEGIKAHYLLQSSDITRHVERTKFAT